MVKVLVTQKGLPGRRKENGLPLLFYMIPFSLVTHQEDLGPESKLNEVNGSSSGNH